jgi:hypothetical protein
LVGVINNVFLPAARRFPPAVDAGSLHLGNGAAVEPTVGLIDLGHRDIATAQAEAGLSFPFLVEPMGMIEFDRAEGVDQ